MAKGWRPVAIADDLYQTAKEYYEETKEELKLRHGLGSLTAFPSFCIREYLKEKKTIKPFSKIGSI